MIEFYGKFNLIEKVNDSLYILKIEKDLKEYIKFKYNY